MHPGLTIEFVLPRRSTKTGGGDGAGLDPRAEHDLTALRRHHGDLPIATEAAVPPVRMPDLFPGVPDTHLVTSCSTVDVPDGPMPLRRAGNAPATLVALATTLAPIRAAIVSEPGC